jgi:hypothetical protein
MICPKIMCRVSLSVAFLPLVALAIPEIRNASSQIRSAAARREGLEQVKNFYLADRCFQVDSESTRPLIKGDVIAAPLETSCYISNGTFLFVVLNPDNGAVTVSEVYSKRELDNYSSQAQNQQ